MKKIYSKGFKLIELLVVVAIIGILASVVLASLNSARAKGNDAKIKGQLSSIRAAAEIFYSTNNNYGTATLTGTFTGATIGANCGGSASTTTAADFWSNSDSGLFNLTSGSNYPSGTAGVCSSNGSAWAVSAKLSTGGFWCVDSTGASRPIAATITGGTDYACPQS